MKSFVELILLALALAMDCFTVSVVCGVIVRRLRAGTVFSIAFLFGFFQAAMPFIGWFFTSFFHSYIQTVDHWIAFGLLAFLGGKMIYDSFGPEEAPPSIDPRSLKSQIVLAIATSIDALAVGISFACTGYDSAGQLWLPLWIIGIVSFVMSILGFVLGARFGKAVTRYMRPELLGGLVLIGIGVRILIEHLT